jgi:branched-chain amino acid transport system substrate-binding protein
LWDITLETKTQRREGEKVTVKFKIMAITLILMLCSTIFIAAEAESSENPIRMGFAYTLSGGLRELGVISAVGNRIGADEVNRNGGVLGRPLEIVVNDDKVQIETATSIFKKYVESEKMPVVGGMFISGINLAIKPIVQKAKTVYYTWGATADKLYQPVAESKWTFGIVQTNTEILKIAILGAKKKGWKRVALYYTASGAGLEANELIKEIAPRYGIEFVGSVGTSYGETEVFSRVKELKDLNPDFIIGFNYGTEGVALVKALKRLNWKPGVVYWSGPMNDIIRAVGMGNIDGWYAASYADWTSPRAQGVYKAAQQDYSATFASWQPFLYMGYDAIKITAKAIEMAGSIDSAAIRDAFERIKNFPIASGNKGSSLTYSPQKHYGLTAEDDGLLIHFTQGKVEPVPITK